MNAIASELASILGAESALVGWDNLESATQSKIKDSLTCSHPPEYFVAPHTQATLAKVISLAGKYNWRVIPCGNGSKLSWGGLVKGADLVVSTQNLNRIIDHAVGDLTVTVEAGIKLAQLQEKLYATGQFLPLDPAYPQTATLGGIISTADTGSWRQGYGGVRDLVLGISFVRADGKTAKAGGRVVKNVAGYDLMKLLTGSYGTLSIITQVTLRTYPLPPASQTIILTGDHTQIITAASSLLASSLTPTCGDILSESVVKKLEIEGGMGLMIRFQSIPNSVAEQCQKVQDMADKLGLQTMIKTEKQEEQILSQLNQLIHPSVTDATITCKVGILPNAAVKFCDYLEQLTDDKGLGIINFGSGLGKLHLEQSNCIEELRDYCQKHQGFLSILTSPSQVKSQIEPWGYGGNALEIMQGIKKQFDPQNILSPDRFSFIKANS